MPTFEENRVTTCQYHVFQLCPLITGSNYCLKKKVTSQMRAAEEPRTKQINQTKTIFATNGDASIQF